MSRDFWQGIALGAAAAGLTAAAVAVRNRRRRRRSPWQRAGRFVQEGGRMVRRGAAMAVDRSRALGRRVMPKALG
ncbi:MAG TPA: hypothetical protein VK008_02260 [Sphingobacteriaceae bacterium]|nr:hypothetical protein [Sphingobacteriaceae bacterium]